MAEKLQATEFHKRKIEEIIKLLDSSVDYGLTDEKVEYASRVYGLNQEENEKEESFFEKIKDQFEDRTVRLLLIAALVSFIANMFCTIMIT